MPKTILDHGPEQMRVKTTLGPDEVIDVATARICAALTDFPGEVPEHEVASLFQRDLDDGIAELQSTIDLLCEAMEILSDLKHEWDTNPPTITKKYERPTSTEE